MSDFINRQVATQTALEFIVEYLGGAFDVDFQLELIKRMNDLSSAQPKHYGDCTGCKHQPRFSREEPCVSCSNNYENKWRQKNG